MEEGLVSVPYFFFENSYSGLAIYENDDALDFLEYDEQVHGYH